MIEEATKYRKIEVLSVRGLNPQTRAIRFKFVDSADRKNFQFQPGSFVMIGIPGFGELPITITTAPSELPEFEIAVRSVGNTSRALNRLQKSDSAHLRGPLGNSINLDKVAGTELTIIAGGIGLAPLRSVIRHISEDSTLVSNLKIIYGAKTPNDLIFKEDLAGWSKFAETHITVDKADTDWEGEVGRIPDVVKKLRFEPDGTVIICGPPIMYQPLAKELVTKHLRKENIFFMLERKMVCGIGKCQHCTCGSKYVCLDGPTFAYSVLENNWEAFV